MEQEPTLNRGPRRGILVLCVYLLVCQFRAVAGVAPAPTSSEDLGPSALAAAPDGQTLYVACATGNQVLRFDPGRGVATAHWPMPASPSGLALSADGKRLVVTCSAARSTVQIVETASGKTLATLAAGYSSGSPVLSTNGTLLWVCNRFDDSVSLFDLRSNREVTRVAVAREPISAALTQDDRFLLVANHLPQGRNETPYVAATISIIDVAQRKVVKELRLPNGSINLRQIVVSPDGKYAGVTLTQGRFQLPVTQLSRGWVNTSLLTLIDLATLEVLNSVALDDVMRGAANPWAAAWSKDGQLLCITHAGTHELSLIDFPGLIAKLAALPAKPLPLTTPIDSSCCCAAEVPNDLAFLRGLRRRVRLTGNGPRALVITGHQAFVADYFSDSLDRLDLATAKAEPASLPLRPAHELSLLRRGERYFNDATLGFQGWQSCASCHDDDGRVDAIQWDLVNDGVGNPKDTKSLVWSHRTPPSMSLGIRATAEIAVRSGIQNSLEAAQPEEVPKAMDEWLKSLQPAPSPHLAAGKLSPSAQRGQRLFLSSEVGCSNCHVPPLFTDLRSYDVGTQNAYDQEARDFDTPTLRELWRTAPYLHDGSAATLRDVITTRNPKNQHGNTSQLKPQELEDLAEYLREL